MQMFIDRNGMYEQVDVDGNVLTKTKLSHPYNYDPIVQYRNRNLVATNTVYTDRMFGWDSKKHDALCKKHFGDVSQYWNSRSPELIEAFLRDYMDRSDLQLVAITEHCNQATGYPLWRFDYI